jgi:hypothetical protein
MKPVSDGVFGRYGLLLAGGVLFLATPMLDRFGGGWLLAAILLALGTWLATVAWLKTEFRRQTRGVRPTGLAKAAGILIAFCLGTPDFARADSPRVAATDRDAWEARVDEQIGRVKRHLDGKEALPAEEYHHLVASLEEAKVDWQSFLVRGAKNYDFPKMLLVNEFCRAPAYYAHPGNLARKLLHRPICQRTSPVRHRCDSPLPLWGRIRESDSPPPLWGKVREGGVPRESSRGEGVVGSEHCAMHSEDSLAVDESVPHSSYFTDTAIETYTPERIASEVASFRPQGAMKITKVKKSGTSEGIWVKDERGRTYILVFDPPFGPEMTTSAEFIGGTLLRIAGYHIPKTCICIVQGTGNPLYDGRRAVATIALKNFDGGWLYAEFRERREIRALQVFGAWINNVDQTEQNTGVTVNDSGVARHYVLDFGASLGSFTFRPQMARLGWTRLFDPFQQFTQPLYNLGIRKVPWEAPYAVHSPAVGYFSDAFDPDRWQPFYRNMGFVEVSEADRVWAARRIAQITDGQIATVVGLAGYSHAEDAQHVAETLIHRRDIIVERYFGGRVVPAPLPQTSPAENSSCLP